jgi:Ankyrin repeats (3 copies)/F-box-like
MSLVDQLPNDIFQVIFSFVDKRKDYLSIMLVCKKWNKFAYKYLDFSIDNQYAIRFTSQNGHLHVVERLLKDPRGRALPCGLKAVDPSAYDQCAIRLASENGRYEVVKRLLQDSRVDPSANDQYAIRWAAENGHLKVVDLLLKDSRVGKVIPTG